MLGDRYKKLQIADPRQMTVQKIDSWAKPMTRTGEVLKRIAFAVNKGVQSNRS